jgi:hypothetical protein
MQPKKKSTKKHSYAATSASLQSCSISRHELASLRSPLAAELKWKNIVFDFSISPREAQQMVTATTIGKKWMIGQNRLPCLEVADGPRVTYCCRSPLAIKGMVASLPSAYIKLSER